ncbi:probable helicase CHR10 isoform X1 [Arachis hypogaea]|uniref:probable helicase CHR10 isoform X1 n=2 Tax=Arachis hypogaea TaxID=3818 RepID=UPI000DEC579D|nr:probable helicase CHR10 isoform X2 [Arachis hypogaea]
MDSTNLSYEQKLQVVARIVDEGDARVCDAPPREVELGLTATLKPHQVEGVSWLIRRYKLGVNVVLDGTRQDFTSYRFTKLSKSIPIITWAIFVTDGWVSEIVKFAPKLDVFKYVGDKEYRRELRMKIYEHVKGQRSTDVLLPFDVLLTTYEIAMMDQDFLSQIPWHYAIIDEAQRLKNPSSVLFNVLKDHYIMPRRLLMTGTPIQNNLSELWSLMHFCMPVVFGTLDQFLFTFKDIGELTSEVHNPRAKEQLKILKGLLGAFMLRRTKSKLVESGNLVLPLLTETTMLVPLTSLQKKVYMSILRKELPKLLALCSGASNHQSLQNIVVQLRKACSHPYLFPGIEPEPFEEGEHLIQACGKLLILDQLLQKLYSSGHRVLLFAQMTHTLDILQDFLELRKYSYERLDGSVRAEERFAAIRSFSSSSANMALNSDPDNPGAFVFMISTRAGGVGLNLVAADTVIFYEQDWNPQVDKQALQRAHRIGQLNHVLCINLVTEHTVEEVIMRRAEKKLRLSLNVIGENVVDHKENEATGVGISDLKSIIFGLHMFDPTEMNDRKHEGISVQELNAMAEKVIAMRDEQNSDKDDRKLEVNARNLLKGHEDTEVSGALSCDLGLDEASYLSWVKNFEEVSKTSCDTMLDSRSRRSSDEDKSSKIESAKKKAEEKKLSKWKSVGYHSLTVDDPICPQDGDIISAAGSVHFVHGDCTAPSNVSLSEPAMVFSCVDTSGRWGHGGMFDSLTRLSTSIGYAYEWASENEDLHLGDLHLIKLEDGHDEQNMDTNTVKWVALAVVQSYNPRRKVPRSDISLLHLEKCLAKTAFSAAQNSASIHMPRIGYQDGSERSEWYTIERLLRKYASIYNINIYVYYYRRVR